MLKETSRINQRNREEQFLGYLSGDGHHNVAVGRIWEMYCSRRGCWGVAFQPEFAEPIVNLTVPVGRDATFTCVVSHLGGYRDTFTSTVVKLV
ncbi:hypothetical protein J437_LFUL000912 [Ladona fulva]|uniref:Uncharacterized protein n=1 Tax=Ladona fulva TaxID=123851 RepID=A0A8K0K824_LADFU|nr:hypothetical protein J437_LFUL000912 [Ladona fulva]